MRFGEHWTGRELAEDRAGADVQRRVVENQRHVSFAHETAERRSLAGAADREVPDVVDALRLVRLRGRRLR
jgi:hypothetical protein